MILGLTPFVFVHVLISLAAIAAGLPVMAGFLRDRPLPRWTAWFLALTLATTVTGFLIPAPPLTPAQAFGIITFIVIGPALYGLYLRGLEGHWRWIYVVGATIVLYLNVFVLVVQSFQKIPLFNAFAPTQTEAPFAIAQGIVLLAFLAIGTLGVLRFRRRRTPRLRPAMG